MSEHTIKELSRQEAEELAAQCKLPEFDSEEDEIQTATDFVLSARRGIACVMLRLSENTLRKQWAQYRRETLESRRFRQWLLDHSCKWDAARGKFVALNFEVTPQQPTR